MLKSYFYYDKISTGKKEKILKKSVVRKLENEIQLNRGRNDYEENTKYCS